jgi:hypothetical protein
MMIDGLTPGGGVRPLSLIRPSAEPEVRRWRGLTSACLELAAKVDPIAMMTCPFTSVPAGCHRAIMVGASGWAMMVKASSPSSVRMCIAWRTMRRAWDSEARLAS